MLSPRTQQTAYLRIWLDQLLLCLAFFLAFNIRSRLQLPAIGGPVPVELFSHVWLLSIALPLYWALSRKNGNGARVSSHGHTDTLRTVAVPFIYLGLLLGTAIFLFQAKTFSRGVFFLFLILGFTFVAWARLLFRFGAANIRSTPEFKKKVLIVGINDEALALHRVVESTDEQNVRVAGHLTGPGETQMESDAHILGTIDDLKHIVEEQVIDDVIFVVSPAELLSCERQVAWCDEVGVTVHLKVDFIRSLVAKTYPTELEGTPMLTLSSAPRDPATLLLKRTTDVVVSCISLLTLSPLLLVAALAVKLTSRGPLIFSQERVGLNGRLFRFYKFRSMYQDAERQRKQVESLNEMTGPVFKIQDDPRITPVGRWLRRFSIDELPQLWNVLRGHMSLVGPRPPLAAEVQQYQRWQRRRLSMKPGITCLWQVNGRNQIQFEDWMKLDLEYIDNWSLGLDLKILLRTIPAVMLARGAR